jgi:putative tricarboxylic transport membrane protein
MIGMVGMDPLTGQGRFTFGSVGLLGGINYISAMIGLFGLSEVLYQVRQIDVEPIKQKIGRLIPEWSLIYKYKYLTLRSSLIGVFIGALPGAGGDLAALIAYDNAKKTVKNPSRPFGQGALEGLVAPESANNAAIGGAFIPMLTLGIPGDAVTAIMIGALFIHGLRPGPMLMIESPDLFWMIVSSLMLSNVFLLIFGLTGVRIFTKVIEAPKYMVMPMIAILCVVGAFVINNNINDVYWMTGFGILGYILKSYKFEVGPVVLGIILGPMVDVNFRRAMQMVRADYTDFIKSLVTNPISLVLTIFIVIFALSQFSLTNRWFRALFHK